MDIRDLQSKQAALRAEFEAMLAKCVDEKREPTTEEDARFDLLKAQMAANDKLLRRAEELRETERAVEAKPVAVVESVHDRRQDQPWDTAGDFFAAVRAAGVSNVIDPRLFAGAASGLSQKVPSEGGFLVPPQVSTEIWNGMSESPASLLSLCDQYTVVGDSITFNANAETSRVQGSLYGGVRAYWNAEADLMTSSKPKFRQVKLEPQELTAMIYCTDKLLANSGPALGQFLTRAGSDAIMHLINEAIIEGTGAGQPLGLLNAACKVEVAKETNQAADTLVQENVSKMWARMHPLCRSTAVWLHNVDVEPQLDALSTAVKNVAGTDNVGGYANKVFNPEARTLKGRPLVPAEFCSTIGDAGDIILVDLKAYAAGLRGSVKTDMSMHVRFLYNETAFRFVFAVDGQPWLGSAITPAKGSNTLSSIVTLAARA